MRWVVFERSPEATEGMGVAALGFETLDGVAHGQRRLGAWLEDARGDTIVDLNRALAVKLAAEDAGAPEAEADSLLPADARLFLRRLPDSLFAARDALRFVTESLGRYDAPDLEAAGVALPRRSVRLAAPVQRPSKLVAVGSDGELFLVAPSALAGPEDDLPLPAGLRLRCSPQLAIALGRRVRGVAPERALECVAGYAPALPFHVEGEGAPRGTLRHSGDGFVPLGPALRAAAHTPDPHDLRIELRLSGRTLQRTHTKELPLSIAELVARASERMTLEPGDVLLSGAPPEPSEPLPELRDGDVVEVEIERLGRLAVYLKSEAQAGA